MDGYKLRNQERELYNVTMRDIREFTNIMAEDNDEFTKYFKYKETPDLSSFTLLKRM